MSFIQSVGRAFDQRPVLKYATNGIGALALAFGGSLVLEYPEWGWSLGVIGLVLVEGATFAYDRYTIREDARRTLQQALNGLIAYLEQAVPPESRSLRANLMLVEGDALRIAYATDGYDDSEWRLSWYRPQGCCGSAWEEGQTKFAPEDMDPPELPMDPNNKNPNKSWGMSLEQMKVTTTIAAVISVPVRRHGDRQIVGVFNVDDSKPVAQSVLGKEHQSAVETFGCSIPPILERAGLSIPVRGTGG